MNWDLNKMASCALTPSLDGWVNADSHISVKMINGVPVFTTSRCTGQKLYWDDRPDYKHWSCEISYGGADQYMVFIKTLVPGKPSRIYWENSY